MSQTKHRNTKFVDADAHKKALQHVMKQRSHWSVPKITAFCKTCKNLPELIDFNIKIEDAYQNFWKNDMRTVVRFAKRFIELLKWITTDEHRQVIVLNFAYYDFALIQKIYTRFYHIESIVKRMQIAMSVIEIFQITPTLSSLNDAQRTHLNKIQQGIYRTWMAFWSDDTSIKFFNISSANSSSLNTYTYTHTDDHPSISSPLMIDDIDDLLIEQKDDADNETDDFDENNSIFTIDENEDLTDDIHDKNEKNKRNFKDMDFDDDDDDIGDQPLRVDSFLPINDRSGIPIIRTINIGDELNDINKQLVFISDIIAWIKQQIIRIKPKLQQNKNKLNNNHQHTFNAIIVCLRKLLLDSAAITSLCVSTPNDENTSNNNKNNNNNKQDTSSYLRMIIDIVRDLTDECCKCKQKAECIQLFKSILADVADNKLTHHLVVQLLQVFIDRISNHQYKAQTASMDENNMEEKKENEKNIKNKNKNKYLSSKYIFHIRVLNCKYFVDDKRYANDINAAYGDYLKNTIANIINILTKRRFDILYVLSSVSDDKSEEKENNYSRLMIGVDVSKLINHNELELNRSVSIVSDEIMQHKNIQDGSYRLNIRFYPIYSGCKHISESDFFFHRGLSLRDEINKIIRKKKKYNGLMKSVLCLALTKQPTDNIIFQRFRLLKKLKDILIKVHGHNARYEIFGSMATKLDHIESDLDISIHLSADNILSFANYFKHNETVDLTVEVKQHRIQRILKPIYEEIIKVPNFKVIFLEHATVPIVKLTDENNGLQSDISVCLTQSVIKTKLIKKYVSIDWRVKPLVLAIKHWVKTRKLNNTHRGDLNSFGFTLMIIHYLQNLNAPILPILQINMNEINKNKDYEPDWVKPEKFASFGQKNKRNIGELFSGFFTYFHNEFKPTIHAISITHNLRKNKINGFLNKNVCHLQNNHNNILIVLDPLDNTDNIGRRVTDVTWNNMQKEFQLAAQITTNN